MSSNSSNSVWLVIDSLTFGGIETHVLELARGLKQFNTPLKVWFVRRYDSPSQLAQKLEENQIDFGYLSDGDGSYFSNLLSYIKTHKPAVLHSHGYKASIVTKLAKLLTGVRQVSTYHAGESPKGTVAIYDALDRYSSFISNSSISVSDQIASKILTRSEVFNNFIDNQNTKLSCGKQIAFVGRLSEEKAPDRMLDLAQLNQALNFEIYGDGPMLSSLTSSAPSNVTFHGHQTDMPSVWSHIGLLVICSRYEGLPMTALEAMARGIPVLSLDVGNMSKLIEHGNNGYIAASMEELNQQLAEIVSLSSEQQSQLRERARTTINNHYSINAVIPDLLSLYFPSRPQTDSQIEK